MLKKCFRGPNTGNVGVFCTERSQKLPLVSAGAAVSKHTHNEEVKKDVFAKFQPRKHVLQ